MTPLPDADLLEAYLDGRLAAAELATLEARLLREPGVADALVRLAREEAILAEWARAAQVADSAAAERTADPGFAIASATVGPNPLPRIRRRTLYRAAILSIVSAAAVILLAVLGVALMRQGTNREPYFLAELEEVQGDVSIRTDSGAIIAAQPGQKLLAGQEVRTGPDESYAVLKYEDKSRLELSPDTLIRLAGEREPATKNKRARGKRIFLNDGVLAAEVVDQPESDPMVVTTPHAELQVWQSTFSSVSALDTTRIELDEGRIQFTRKSDGQSIRVPRGSYAVAAAPAEPFAPHPLAARVKKPRAVLKEVAGPILSMTYSPDGKMLAIGCRDGSITVCEPQTGVERAVLAGHKKTSPPMFSPDGKIMAAIVEDRTVTWWDTTTFQEQRSFSRGKLRFTSVAISPDGKTLATACGDKSVRLWDTATGREEAILRGDGGRILSLAFSPDGKLLAAGVGRGQESGTILLWDIPARQQRTSLLGHRRVVRSIVFSPDGQSLASASDDGMVRVWDPKTGQARLILEGHARKILSVAFSPDGSSLASAGNDNTARLWDLASGAERTIFKARQHRICCVAFSPDGKTLATGGWDKTVKLWDVMRQPS
jgi:WD40 repeat protein